MLSIRSRLATLVRHGYVRACASIPPPTEPPYNQEEKEVRVLTYQERLEKLREKLQLDEQNEFVVPLFKKSLLHGEQIAVKDGCGEYSYLQLYISAKKLASQVSNICGSGASAHVVCLNSNNVLSTLAQWSCWMSGQVVVPLNAEYPTEMLKYLVQDAKTTMIITSSRYEAEASALAQQLELPLLVIDHTFLSPPVESAACINRLVLASHERILIEGTLNNDFYTASNALLLYTAGTTRKPKGVLLTHRNLDAQMRCLLDAWQFNAADSLLHALPLKHLHGCFSAFLCPLSVGGKITMHDDFNSHNVWSTMLGINAPAKERVNSFLATPALYSQLIAEYDKIFAKDSRMVEYIEQYCRKNLRLMVSAAASLPSGIFHRWREITGHNLLECFSTTETGIVISNQYEEDDDKPRLMTVGQPLPGVKLRLVGAQNKVLMMWPPEDAGESTGETDAAETYTVDVTNPKSNKLVGELQLAGATVFKGYFNRPEEITAELVDGDYFRTGDIATYENDVFEIHGSSSVDIIETEGHKVCSLELESLLSTHPSIKDVAVLGIPDAILGERIGVICVLKPDTSLDLNALKSFCAQMLPSHKHPMAMQIVEDLPREQGRTKLSKFELIKMYFSCKNKL